ncbi:hypothetical protein [Cohnella thailandensis]|uniref:Uncharacterized protein n=1 Tax=Cohnella thailandensis TaxID=557557 RepID=A0A841SZ43_9BACL|nr:hypothetical protein [Cohnella thailandensis]MBB6634897.1 hypothetical protein [Cohnella thailandensis]MBP1975881.1 hypothetical protein [Cohnella thailandensis]
MGVIAFIGFILAVIVLFGIEINTRKLLVAQEQTLAVQEEILEILKRRDGEIE